MSRSFHKSPNLRPRPARKTFKIQQYGGYCRLTFPPEAADHLAVGEDTHVRLSYWRAGDKVVLDEDAVIVEVVRE